MVDERSPHDLLGQPAAPRGTPVYGIGDVDGMNDLLCNLLRASEADAAAAGLPATVVFLGDVVNRGTQARQMLDRPARGACRHGVKPI